jgi:hypothetical protein
LKRFQSEILTLMLTAFAKLSLPVTRI